MKVTFRPDGGLCEIPSLQGNAGAARGFTTAGVHVEAAKAEVKCDGKPGKWLKFWLETYVNTLVMCLVHIIFVNFRYTCGSAIEEPKAHQQT